MTCDNGRMNASKHEGHDPTNAASSQRLHRGLLLGSTKGYEIVVLIGALVLAVILAVGSLTLWSGNNWAQLLASWCGVASALTFSALLAADLYRPQLLTRRRLMQAIYLLISLAIIAILSAITGFFI